MQMGFTTMPRQCNPAIWGPENLFGEQGRLQEQSLQTTTQMMAQLSGVFSVGEREFKWMSMTYLVFVKGDRAFGVYY
jgi:hypothetical protein